MNTYLILHMGSSLLAPTNMGEFLQLVSNGSFVTPRLRARAFPAEM
ncbi:Hypothetical protein BIBO1_0545 [Brucella inopinata BO1]|nr:Hypothetical protein BIBO1_0545 [Brucella inopinata BO1]